MSEKGSGSLGCADPMLGAFLVALWIWCAANWPAVDAALHRLIAP